jgi:uncharacterized protein YjbJ (UPF0337 family)
MNEDRFAGTAKTVAGKAEEGFGRATGDVKTQLQGKARQVEGEVQDFYGQARDKATEAYGQARDKATEAAQAVREGASEMDDFIRKTIEQRPYTTAAIALGIGFLIGRLGRRAD